MAPTMVIAFATAIIFLIVDFIFPDKI